MTDKEILLIVLIKVIANGWTDSRHKDWKLSDFIENIDNCLYLTIFSPDFAKAYWGEEKHKLSVNYNREHGHYCEKCYYEENCDTLDTDYCWQYYQYEMLNEVQNGRNPLKYIEKFLN